jgi:glycosyltransferase involved in cell wall biosynthesis
MINNGVNGYLCEPDDVASLSDALLLSLDLRRDLIRNPAYHGGQLNDFL